MPLKTPEFRIAVTAGLLISSAVLAVGQSHASGNVTVDITVQLPAGGLARRVDLTGSLSVPTGTLQANPTFSGVATVEASVQNPINPNSSVESPLGWVNLQAKDFNFTATSLDSMSLKNNVLTITGSGTVDSKGDYGFLMQVMKAGEGSEKDKVRIRIFTKANHIVIFDNQPNTKPDAALGDVTVLSAISDLKPLGK